MSSKQYPGGPDDLGAPKRPNASFGPTVPDRRDERAPEQQLLDEDVLRGLKELGGDDDPGLFLELIDMFLQDAPQRMEEIRRGLAERDMRLLERAAHTLKSASANVGAMSLSGVCRRMEESIRMHNDKDVPALVEESRRLWPCVEAALRAAKS